MTKHARSISFELDLSDLARPFCRLDATNGERAGGGKCHGPGTGAQKIGSGSLSPGHKAWCVPIGDADAETPVAVHPMGETDVLRGAQA